MAGRTPPYVERAFDEALLRKCREFAQGREAVRWLSLETAAGRGNTRTLKHLAEEIGRDLSLRYSLSSIFVDAMPAGDAPAPEPRPLMAAITEPLRGPFARAANHLKKHRYRPFLAALVFVLIGVPLAASVWYLTEVKGSHSAAGFIAFVGEHLTVSIALFFGAIAFPALLFELIKALVVHKGHLSADDVRDLSTPDAVGRGLLRGAQNRLGTVLLIDKAHLFDRTSRAMLAQIVSPPRESVPLRQFLGRYRLLVVTVDEMQTWGEMAGKRGVKFETVTVPEFTLAEVRDIARHNAESLALVQRADADDEEATETIESARHDVRLLFGTRDDLRDEMARVYRDAEAKNITGERFGLDHLLLYQAIRTAGGGGSLHTTTIDLAAWLKTHKRTPHFRDFGLRVPLQRDIEKLVESLPGLPLISRSGREVVFDYRCARELLEVVRNTDREAASQAYAYWFEDASATVGVLSPALISISMRPEVKERIRRAAWYAKEIVEYDDAAEAFEALPPDRRTELRLRMGNMLLLAAALEHRDGEMVACANNVGDALDWLQAASVPEAEHLIEAAFIEVSESYALSFEQVLKNGRDNLLTLRPALADGAAARSFARWEALRRGEEVASEPEPVGAPAAVVNRWRLTEAILRIRSERGFLFSGESEVGVDVPAPVDTDGRHVAAIFLRQIAVHAAATSKPEMASDLLIDWGAMIERRPLAVGLGDEILECLERGAYYESALHVIGSGGVAPIEEADAGRRGDEALERALVLLSFAEWQGIAALLSFERGLLLYAMSRHAATKEPWEAWEQMFRECVVIEEGREEFFLTAEIQHLRWCYFRDLATDRALEDGYESYRAARRLRMSNSFIVGMHRVFALKFQHYGHHQHYERSAELYEQWARELAPTAEARPHWEPYHSRLEFEQAAQLTLAAQARRLNREIAAAETLLIEAESLLGDDTGPEATAVRQSIEFQRANIAMRTDRNAGYAVFRSLWNKLEVSANVASIALSAIVQLESQLGMSADPWPRIDVQPAPDPDAPQFSLEPFDIEAEITRFEYRHRQLRLMIAMGNTATPNITRAIMDITDVALNDHLDATGLMPLLEGAERYTTAIHHEGHRLRALRLLVTVSEQAEEWVRVYTAVADEEQKLQEREILNELRSGKAGSWFSFADRMHYLYDPLVDRNRHDSALNAKVTEAGGDPEEVVAAYEAREPSFQQAEDLIEAGNYAAALAVLDAIIPDATIPWVFYGDLRGLQRWMSAASEVGVDNDVLEARAQQLRSFSARYVQQLSRTIDNAQVQEIAVRILAILEEAAGASARLPIASPHDESAVDPSPGDRRFEASF